jgi:paraquat-inducible protein A
VATLARDFGSSDPRTPALLVCPECDLVQRVPAGGTWGAIACCRCGATLCRRIPRALDTTLALMVAAAVLFVIANVTPVMSLDMQGRHNEATLLGIAKALHGAGMTPVALLVALTVIVMPGLEILAMLWLLVPLRLGLAPEGLHVVSRTLAAVRPWAMVEVFTLAALVSIGRLGHLADLHLGVAFWAMGALMFVFALTDTVFDEHVLWEHAAALGQRPPAAGLRRVRKPDSLARTTALLVAAYALYLPANLLPILETGEIGGAKASDTILSGVVKLWHGGWWPLAVVILIASIVIPFAKLVVLTGLVVSVRRGGAARLRGRTRLYRLVDVIGKWSMIDIYVGGLLVGLVQFEAFASVAPGPAALAFGAVVVLTMLASQSFDPRLLWDAAGARRG